MRCKRFAATLVVLLTVCLLPVFSARAATSTKSFIANGTLSVNGSETVFLNTSNQVYVKGSPDILLEGSWSTVALNSGSFTCEKTGSFTVQGNSEGSATFVNKVNGSYVKIQGDFFSVSGDVELFGKTVIAGGSPVVKNTSGSYALDVTGGSVNMQGTFGALTIKGGAVMVSADTTLSSVSLSGGGKITVSAGKTLKVGSQTVTPLGEQTFSNLTDSGALKLPTSSNGYRQVTGNWTLEGSTTIKNTSTDLNSTTISVPSGATLTVGGDKSGQAMVFQGVDGSAGNLVVTSGMTVTILDNSNTSSMGSVTLQGLDGMAGGELLVYRKGLQCSSITVNKGMLTLQRNVSVTTQTSIDIASEGHIVFKASAGLQNAERSVQNVASSDFTLNTWGELSNGVVALNGPWILKTGVSATVSKGSALSSEPKVEGQGGEMTVSGAGVYAKGAFSKLNNVTDESPLNVHGEESVCTGDPALSVTPTKETRFSAWGVLTGDAILASGAHPVGYAYENLTGAWKLTPGQYVYIYSSGYSCTFGHTHGTASVEPTTTDTTGPKPTIYLEGENLDITALEGIESVSSAGAIVTGNGQTTLNADYTYVKGEFKELTGTAILAGKTIITNANTSSSVIITGNGNKLEVNGSTGGVVITQGVFASITTPEGRAVKLTDSAGAGNDLTVQGGKFAVADPNASAYKLTVSGGTGSVEGSFLQLNVTGGTVSDSAQITLSNKDDTVLSVTGGEVTLDDKPQITLTESKTSNNAILVQTGALELWNGTVIANGVGSAVVYVGNEGKFYMGKADNLAVYSSEETPTLKSYDKNGIGVSIGKGGEGWLRAGEIIFYGQSARGINVSGTAHIYPNNQYGDGVVKDGVSNSLFYVHGADQSTAAMWVEKGGSFDFRGRGALLEEPSPHEGVNFAVYIDVDASKDIEYPFSGGTFRGKVRYFSNETTKNDIQDFIPPNHYLRYDGDSPCYTFTDGTYGVLPYATGDAGRDTPADYGSYEKVHEATLQYSTFTPNEEDTVFMQFGDYKKEKYYTIADAEWELRQQMKTAGGSYQIPAGIVRNDGNLILDANVFHHTTLVPATPETSVWGMGKKSGDVEVSGTGHVLYLAGRHILYSGKNRANAELKDIYPAASDGGYGYESTTDAQQVFDIKSGADLTILDCVPHDNPPGYGVDTDDDRTSNDNGGYIGTGTIAYQYTAEHPCRAIHNAGTLNVVSAQILSTKESVYTVSGSTTNIGDTNQAYGDFTNDENNSNKLIDIIGDAISLSMENGTVNLNGGVVGNLSNSSATAIGIEIRGGTLNLNGGVVTGCSSGGTGVRTTGGTSVIHGGCIYGEYKDDDEAAAASRNSLLVQGGTVWLNIDEQHGVSPGREDTQAARYLTTRVPDTLATSACHHIENVYVRAKAASTDSVLYVSVDSDPSQLGGKGCRTITSHTRINGALKCDGGLTYFYQGIVMGPTTVTGAGTGSDFTTQFFVNDGHFSSLSIQSGLAAGSYTFCASENGKDLQDRVQIHGGSYTSISVADLVSSVPAIDAQKILGFWSHAHDLDEASGGAKDWTRYNHYAENNVSATRNEDGYWTVEDELKTSNDTDRAPDTPTITAGSGKAVVVRDALEGFYRWIQADTTSGTPWPSYVLAVNLFLDTDATFNICNLLFNCVKNVDPTYPFSVGKGEHAVDMNNWGIFGKCDSGPLLSVPSGSKLVISNGAGGDGSHAEATQKRVRNLSTNSASVVVAVQDGGTFLLENKNKAKGYDEITLRASGTVVTVASGGEFTVNAGILTGNSYALNSAGDVTLNRPQEENVTQLTGGTTGIVNTGTLTVQGLDATNVVTVTGTGTDGVNSSDGWITAQYAHVTGGTNGIVNSSDQLNNQGDAASGVTMKLTNVKITGTSADGVNTSGGSLYMADSEVTGGANGIVNSSQNLNKEGDTAIGVTMQLTNVTITGSSAEGINTSGGSLYMADSAVTGKTNGINNASGQQSQSKDRSGTPDETVTLIKTTVTGQSGKGVINTAGTLYLSGVTVTGQTDGIDNSSALTDSSESKITITLTEESYPSPEDNSVTLKQKSSVQGNTGVGIVTSDGLLDITSSTVTGSYSDETNPTHGIKAEGFASVAIHAGSQINADQHDDSAAPSDTASTFLCEATGTVTIDGGSFARGKGYGVEQTSGEFTITGGSLGKYTLSGGELTVQNNPDGGQATFVSITQSDGSATLKGDVSMDAYTHTGGEVTVDASPTFKTFTAKAAEKGTVQLNGGRYTVSIENKSGKLDALLGDKAIIVCDGSNTAETHDYAESDVIDEYILKNETLLQTQTYNKSASGETVNLSAPFFITRPDIQSIDINLPKKTYIAGETLDLTGATLTLHYLDETTKEISVLDDDNKQLSTVTLKDGDENEYKHNETVVSETAGTKTLTVKYEYATAPTTVDLTIVNRKLVSIAVTKFPDNVVCLQKQTEIKRGGGEVTLTYDFGEPDVLLFGKRDDAGTYLFTVTPSNGYGADAETPPEFDNRTTGAQTVNVSYVQHYQANDDAETENITQTTTLTINVKDNNAASIKIETPPAKTDYIAYQELDMSGCELTLTYKDDTTETVSYADLALTNLQDTALQDGETSRVFIPDFEDVPLTQLGTYSVVVTYRCDDNATTLEANQKITVVRRTLKSVELVELPTKDVVNGYLEDNDPDIDLDLTGAVMKVTYDSGEVEIDLPNDAVKVLETFDIKTPGDQSLTLQYTESGPTENPGTAETTLTVTVTPKSIIHFEIAPPTGGFTCVLHEPYPDLTGGVLKLLYDNFKTEDISLDNYSWENVVNLETDFDIALNAIDSSLVGETAATFVHETTTQDCKVNVLPLYDFVKNALLNGEYEITVRSKTPETSAILVLACYDPKTDQVSGQWMKLLDLSDPDDRKGTLEVPDGADNDRWELILLDTMGVSLCDSVSRISSGA